MSKGSNLVSFPVKVPSEDPASLCAELVEAILKGKSVTIEIEDLAIHLIQPSKKKVASDNP